MRSSNGKRLFLLQLTCAPLTFLFVGVATAQEKEKAIIEQTEKVKDAAIWLSGDKLTWLFLGQLAFGAILAIATAATLKGNILQLLDQQRGRLVLQIITIFFICTITGNLTLMKIFEPGVAAAMFGAVLGYVFGSGQPAKGNAKPKPEAKDSEMKPA